MARGTNDDDEIAIEDPEEAEDEWGDEEAGDAAAAAGIIAHLFSTGQDRGGHSDADIAARLSSPQALTERDIKWNSGYRQAGWEPPRQPIQQIIKLLGKLEHVSGYRRPRDIFADWLDLVEATLHMLPQQMLFMRLHRIPMPPEEEPAEVQAVFKRVMRIYGERWKEAMALFHQAYEILNDAAQGMVFDALGAIYLALEIGNARAGQYFTPWNLAHMSAMMTMGSVELEVIDNMAAAIDAWPGSEMYKLMGMQWGREHPATTRWIWEKHIDPLYLMTEHLRVLEPCSGAGIFLLAALAETPPWIVNYQLIDFYAIDIDPMCAQMTRTQLLLYGANGYALLCQLPLVAPEENLPTFAQIEHRYLQIASHVQCANALSHEWERGEDGIWTMVYWADTLAGKARAAEREREAAEAQARAAGEKEQQKATQEVRKVKEKAKAQGQELLFDIELPPVEEREALAADLKHANGNENGTHTAAETTPGAAGDWIAFVERAQAAKGTPEAKTGNVTAQNAVEEIAEDLTQGTLF